MLSLEVTDDEAQTARVLGRIAEKEGLGLSLDPDRYERWQEYQRWLSRGPRKVYIPYAKVLANAIPPKAVRLRRDFPQLLTAIKAHALLHRDYREVEDGVIEATLTDYSIVRDLMVEVMADNIDMMVSATMRQTVEAVKKLQPTDALQVGTYLGIHKASALRRLEKAIEAGFVINLERRRYAPGLYRTSGLAMPTTDLLPTAEVLAKL
jgi:hypothetical protein